MVLLASAVFPAEAQDVVGKAELGVVGIEGDWLAGLARLVAYDRKGYVLASEA